MSPTKKIAVSSGIVAGAVIIAFAVWFVSVMFTAYHAAAFLTAFQKIHETKPPLSTAQVEQLVGQPLRIDHTETTGLTGDVYHYATYPSGGDFQIVFVNGAVFNTEFSRGAIK